MGDLISRQDAINLVKHRMKHNPMKSVEFIQGLQDAYLRVISDLNRLPSADVVEVKRGKWIPIKDDEHWYVLRWECSCCGFWTTSDKMANYCEDCGADMRERREDDK